MSRVAEARLRCVQCGVGEFDTAGCDQRCCVEAGDVLGDHDAIRELVEAEATVTAGDVVRGVDAVRALCTSPRS
jgi:hypothetical protein